MAGCGGGILAESGVAVFVADTLIDLGIEGELLGWGEFSTLYKPLLRLYNFDFVDFAKILIA